MRLMTQVLYPYLRTFVVVYFDDIFIYSQSHEDHIEHLRKVCEVLRSKKLYANLKKCDFITTQVDFLGFVVSNKGVSADNCESVGHC